MNKRSLSLIRKIVKELNLNLQSFTVLTEVGSGNFQFLPIIAALAGADEVYAWTSDSKYSLGIENIEKCQLLAEELGLLDKIHFSNGDRPGEHIQKADIITNSDHVRPLNSEFISRMKNDSVISLMYEAWEIRASDIDIDACTKRGVKVAGVWENHPGIKVFDMVGSLAVKLSLEAGYEIAQNSIVVWSDDEFGKESVKAFESFGATDVILTNNKEELYSKFQGTDFIYICDYSESRPYFGKDALFDLSKMKELNPNFGVVHLYGDINNNLLQDSGVDVYPSEPGKVKVMSRTLGHLGPLPVFKLQTAGLKVGEYIIKGESDNLVQPINF